MISKKILIKALPIAVLGVLLIFYLYTNKSRVVVALDDYYFKSSTSFRFEQEGQYGAKVFRASENLPSGFLFLNGEQYANIDDYQKKRVESGDILLVCLADGPSTGQYCDYILSSRKIENDGVIAFEYLMHKIKEDRSNGNTFEKTEDMFGPHVDVLLESNNLLKLVVMDVTEDLGDDYPKPLSNEEIEQVIYSIHKK